MTKNDRLVVDMGRHGFHGATIANHCGCTVGHVYRTCRAAGVRLRDYRDGKTKVAKQTIALVKQNVRAVKRRTG
jgi:hypothetical protein